MYNANLLVNDETVSQETVQTNSFMCTGEVELVELALPVNFCQVRPLERTGINGSFHLLCS